MTGCVSGPAGVRCGSTHVWETSGRIPATATVRSPAASLCLAMRVLSRLMPDKKVFRDSLQWAARPETESMESSRDETADRALSTRDLESSTRIEQAVLIILRSFGRATVKTQQPIQPSCPGRACVRFSFVFHPIAPSRFAQNCVTDPIDSYHRESGIGRHRGV